MALIKLHNLKQALVENIYLSLTYTISVDEVGPF